MVEKTLGPLPKYWTIGKPEHVNVIKALKRPLSGYVGGKPSDGYWVNQLSDDWREVFDVNFAIPCNSATTGLMAACMAAGIGHGDEVWVSSYTMSATATAPMILGAKVKFMDIDPELFCMSFRFPKRPPMAIIITNLFGRSAYLLDLRKYCDLWNIILIEDNAQAPFATYDGKYTGTYGHIGVFSLNVHKHIQCGEGGVIVTNGANYAEGIEASINHGELNPSFICPKYSTGSNFRMTETTAAIACAQLKKGPKLVQTRIALAEATTDIFLEVPFIKPPECRVGDVHAYYMWAGKVTGDNPKPKRQSFIERLRGRGVPFKAGYITPLHTLFEENYSLPVVEEIENERLITFEVCAYDPKSHHLKRMRDIILQEADAVEKERLDDTREERSHEGSDRNPVEVSGSH